MTTLNPLIVTKDSLHAIRHWPIELRALFDPQADRELAERRAAALSARALALVA